MTQTSPAARGGSITYRPALDGLRGLAVAAVIAFHLGYPWAKGGYLGVSVFFTLSGFLITTLLVSERSATGRTDLKRFWSRRARRLLPPALLGLVLAAVVTRTMPQAPLGSNIDLLAALGDVANWRFLLAGRSYGALFTAPSAALHYWSLSIEEQFYALYPLLAVAAFRNRANPRRLLRWCAIGVACSWAALLTAGVTGQHDFAYYSTITRAGELLVGAMAAISIRLQAGRHVAEPGRARDVPELAALVAVGVLIVMIPQSSHALELGVLPIVAVLSAIVVTGAYRGGPLAVLVGWRPLVDLGRISYGVYVYHWPILLWLTADRTGLHGLALTGARLAVTLVVALLSYHLVERPVRAGRWPSPRVALRVAPAAYGCAAIIIALVARGATPAIDFAAAQDQLRAAAAVTTVPVPTPPPNVVILGDSTALMMGLGVAQWGTNTGKLHVVGGVTPLGCSITRGGERRYQGGEGSTTPECDAWPDTWTAQLTATPADVALVLEGPWEVADRKLPGDDEWRHVGDPVFDAYLHNELLAAVDLLLQHVHAVVLLTSPDIQDDLALPNRPATPFTENDPARMAAFNDALWKVAAERSAVHVVDLNAHLRSLPGGEMDLSLRPDGIHFTPDTTNVVAPWIGQSLLDAVAHS